MIGQYKLHDNCVIVCAGNGKNDHAIVNDLSTAMVSRLVHIHMKVDVDDWLDNVAYKQNYDPRIIAFISNYRDKLMDFDPEDENREGQPFCCPRSWEFVNRILKVPSFEINSITQYLLQGTISPDVAIQFTAFCQAADELEDINVIIKSPEKAKIPEKSATQWFAIVSMLQNFTEDRLDSFEKYLSRFDNIAMEVLFYRSLASQYPQISSNPIFRHKMEQVAQYIRTKAKERGNF